MLTVIFSKKLAPVQVASYREASIVVRKYISGKGMGSSEFYADLPFTTTSKGAAIHDDNGRQIAFVSYNGRVWEGVEDMKLGHTELF
jgi:hypothetical protein